MDMKDITYIVVEGLSGGGVKKVKGSVEEYREEYELDGRMRPDKTFEQMKTVCGISCLAVWSGAITVLGLVQKFLG